MTPCTCESDPGRECDLHPVPAATLEAIAGPPRLQPLARGYTEPKAACELCRIHAQRSRHHPWPKELLPKGDPRRGAKMMLCAGCHQKIHIVLTNRQLFDTYHTPAMLLKHPTIAVWITRKREHPEDFTRKGFERYYPQGHPKHKPRHER